MKDDDAEHGQPEREDKSATPQKPKRQSRKAGDKKWTLRQHWQRATTTKRLRWVLEGVGFFVGLLILANYTWGNLQTMWHFREKHAPLILNTRRDFLQTYKCVPPEPTTPASQGKFLTGDIDKTYKNVGNATAYDVIGFVADISKAIPVKPTGDPSYDKRFIANSNDCVPTMKMDLKLKGSPLEAGREETPHATGDTAGLPPQVKSGDLVMYETKSCVTYADHDGIRHGTCDLYTLFTASP